MEKIEQALELTKFNAAIVAQSKDNPSFLSILLSDLSDEETEENNAGYGWYLYLEHLKPDKRLSPAFIELEPEEVQFLQNTLKKVLYKLTILEKVKVDGFYTMNYDGIKNLKLEIKSQNGEVWLELILSSKSHKKFITTLTTEDVRDLLQNLQTVKGIGDTMVKQLEAIEALTENLTKQVTMGQTATASLPTPAAAPAPAAPTPVAAAPAVTQSDSEEPIDATKLVKQLENMANTTRTKPKMIY